MVYRVQDSIRNFVRKPNLHECLISFGRVMQLYMELIAKYTSNFKIYLQQRPGALKYILSTDSIV